MRLRTTATVLGYRPGEEFVIDDTDAAEVTTVAPYITGGHVVVVDEEGAPTSPEELVAGLKGADLDTALRDAGLALTGKADDKRARLLEHLTADDGTDEGTGDDQGDDTGGE